MPRCSASSTPAPSCAPTSCDPRGTSSLPEDLRWILDAHLAPGAVGHGGAPPTARPRRARAAPGDGLDLLAELLQDRQFRTRPELGEEFTDRGSPIKPGEQLGHLLLVAELQGLVCSGPMQGSAPLLRPGRRGRPADPAPHSRGGHGRAGPRASSLGHGPTTIKDFTRWATLTITDTKAALAEIGDDLEQVDVDGIPHWFDPTQVRAAQPGRARGIPLPHL